MKYIVCALPMVICNEVVSLMCLCAIMVCAIYDLCKSAPKGYWR